MDDWLLRELTVEAERVNQKVIRLRAELGDSLEHSHPRCLINVYLINARCINRRYCPRNRVFPNAQCQEFAALRKQQLRISQATNAKSGIEYDRGCYYRAEQGAAPDLIDASNQACSERPCLLFKLQAATQSFQQAELGRRWRKRL